MPSRFTPAQAEAAQLLLDTKALRFGEFRLKLHEANPSAPLSPFYFNLRLIRSHPHALRRFGVLLADAAQPFAPEAFADVPTAATPLVASMCLASDLPMISPRKDAKHHGLGNDVDGAYHAGQRVVLVDDLVTSGASKLEAKLRLELHGLNVVGLVVILDRQQGGIEELARVGIETRSLLTLRPLLDFYREQGAIDAARHDQILAYLAG